MKDSQRLQVIRHLQMYGSITDEEARDYYGIHRLGARIFELRKDGYLIKTGKITGKNRFGHHFNCAKYILLQDGEA